MWKTTHQLCEGRLGVAVAVCPDKSSVADCLAATSCNQLYRSLCGSASSLQPYSRMSQWPCHTKHRRQPFRILYFKSRVYTGVAKRHRRSLGILAEAGSADSLWARAHHPTADDR